MFYVYIFFCNFVNIGGGKDGWFYKKRIVKNGSWL